MVVATKNSVLGAWLCVALLVVASAPVPAQGADYPSRPITLLGAVRGRRQLGDVVMRLVSKRVSDTSSRPS